VESDLPDGLSVLVESLSAAAVDEIPDLNCTITGSCSKKVTSGVESTSTNPVLMPLSTHYKVTIRYRPKLPSSIIRSSGDDVFLRVVCDRSNSHQMSLKSLLVAKVRSNSFESFV
jgi:hypothetical protein